MKKKEDKIEFSDKDIDNLVLAVKEAEQLSGLESTEGLKFIDTLPQVELDIEAQTMKVDGIEIKLIKKLVLDNDKITLHKPRVFVPEFKWEKAWENLIGSDSPSEDEATEDYDRQRSPVFLDKKTRKPLIYTFIIDKDNKLYFASKRAESTTELS